VGDAAILIDSTKTDEIAKALERLSEDKGLREKLRKKGLKRAENFSWEKTGEETLKVYEEILG
ncbi:MAG: glycosyltransferase family 1 protein, partial [Candidatus Aerophobetes bacterium]|nr:glycosyltransferase family 1 protein [Candidatus Aerophobetes bacterium]